LLKIKFGDETGESREYDTYPADKAVRMPLTVECRYIVFHDSAVAATAFRCEHVEIILAAVGLAVSLVETFLAELLTALGAKEVFGVPSLLQSGHTFLEKNIFSYIHEQIYEMKHLRHLRVQIYLEMIDHLFLSMS